VNDKSLLIKYFNLLKEISLGNEKVARARISAAVVLKKRIISIGMNCYKTSPFQIQFQKNPFSIYYHAETYAIKNSLKNVSVEDLRKATLLVCRVKYFPSLKKYMFGIAKPCQGCMKAIELFNIGKVLYTGEGNVIHCLERRTNIIETVSLEEEELMVI